MDKVEVSLYQVKGLSRNGSFVDWKALVDKVSEARLTQLYKTHCTVVLPKESIAGLDNLLENTYRNVRRRPMEGERNARLPAQETRMWR